MLNFRNTRDTWVKCPHQLFEKPGFQKQILGCNKYAKSNHNLYFISENLQEMDTDQYTLIEQSVNHKSTLIEQSLHCCFVAEFHPPAPRTHFHRTLTRNIITNWSGLIGIAHVFFAKTLIERTPKNYLGKHPPTQNHPLVVICNEYWSTSKYQVKRKQYVYFRQN